MRINFLKPQMDTDRHGFKIFQTKSNAQLRKVLFIKHEVKKSRRSRSFLSFYFLRELRVLTNLRVKNFWIAWSGHAMTAKERLGGLCVSLRSLCEQMGSRFCGNDGIGL